jgi:hypothetical protein
VYLRELELQTGFTEMGAARKKVVEIMESYIIGAWI